MSYLGNVYSTVKCSLDYELLCQVHELEVVESNCCQYRTFYFYNCKYVSSSSSYYYYYLFFGKTYCLSNITKHNLTDSHRHRICYSQLIINISYRIYRYIYMIYIYTKFHMSSSNGSLVIAIKPKAKCRFHTAVMFLLCLQQTFMATNVAYIFLKLCYSGSFYYPILYGTNVASASQADFSSMWLLPILGN
jgi:hypothetical protein